MNLQLEGDGQEGRESKQESRAHRQPYSIAVNKTKGEGPRQLVRKWK